MFELTTFLQRRGYNSKAAIWNDWQAGKDFQIATQHSADFGDINREDGPKQPACLMVRYRPSCRNLAASTSKTG